jgi:hypothetical protein
MITGTFTNSNIVLFDLGENPYSPDYIRSHRDEFDEHGNKIYIPDYDDD